MIALSIQLPDKLAKASQNMAKNLGMSRTEFIRQAIQHELETREKQIALDAMAKSFVSLKSNKDYIKESDEIEQGMNDVTPGDEDEWWK